MNAPYSKLELALDGIYKVILLLKKKKYAAIKLEPDQNGTPFVREVPPPAALAPRHPAALPPPPVQQPAVEYCFLIQEN